jgi:hypothetical protein
VPSEIAQTFPPLLDRTLIDRWRVALQATESANNFWAKKKIEKSGMKKNVQTSLQPNKNIARPG